MNATEFLKDKGIEFDAYTQACVQVLLEEYAAKKLNEQKTKQVQDAVLKPLKYVVELADNEVQIITAKELKGWEDSAAEFDGFEGWTIRGTLNY